MTNNWTTNAAAHRDLIMESLHDRYNFDCAPLSFAENSSTLFNDECTAQYVAQKLADIMAQRAERDNPESIRKVPVGWQDFHSYQTADTAYNLVRAAQEKKLQSYPTMLDDYIEAISLSNAPAFISGIADFRKQIYVTKEGEEILGGTLLEMVQQRKSGHSGPGPAR